MGLNDALNVVLTAPQKEQKNYCLFPEIIVGTTFIPTLNCSQQVCGYINKVITLTEGCVFMQDPKLTVRTNRRISY